MLLQRRDYGSRFFVGRREELQVAMSALRSPRVEQQPHHVLFLGAPGIGKTWLLHHIVSRSIEELGDLRCQRCIVYMNCAEPSRMRWRELLLGIQYAAPDLSTTANDGDSIKRKVEHLVQRALNLRRPEERLSFFQELKALDLWVYFLLDDLDKAPNVALGDDQRLPLAQKDFLDYADKLPDVVRVLATASHSYPSGVVNWGERFLHTLWLQLLSEDEARELISRHLVSIKRETTPTEWSNLQDAVLREAGYHPYWIDLLCQSVLIAKAEGKSLDLDRLPEMDRSLRPHFNQLWDYLAVQEEPLEGLGRAEAWRRAELRATLQDLWMKGERGVSGEVPRALELLERGIVAQIEVSGEKRLRIPSARLLTYLKHRLPLRMDWGAILWSPEGMGLVAILSIALASLALLGGLILDQPRLSQIGAAACLVGLVVYFVVWLVMRARRHSLGLD